MSMLKRLDEAAAKALTPTHIIVTEHGNAKIAIQAEAARKAILAEIEAMGWQIVPKAPTDAMLEPVNGSWNPDKYPTTWHQMIAAAPKLES